MAILHNLLFGLKLDNLLFGLKLDNLLFGLKLVGIGIGIYVFSGAFYAKIAFYRCGLSKRELARRLKLDHPLNGLHEIDYDNLKLEKEPLGTGFFGAVYEAIYTKSQSEKIRVAVKTVRDVSSNADRLEQELSIELLLDCQRVMNVCDHPNVVSIYGYSVNVYIPRTSPFDIKTKPEYDVFLVTETCEESLWKFIQRRGKGLDQNHLLEIADQIAQGMTYVAEQGIVHRDLRSENILMTKKGKDIKIGDFGLSQNMKHVYYSTAYFAENRNSQFPVYWAAPESMVESIWTEKSDVWSYGVIMIEMYTAGKIPSHIVPSVRRKGLIPLEKPPACPDTIYEDLIVKCWEVDPRKRPTFKEISAIIRKLHAQFRKPVEEDEKPIPQSPKSVVTS